MYPNQYCKPCEEEKPCVEVPSPPDCIGEPCEEIVLSQCVKYNGPAIPCLGIAANSNLNLNQVLQIIAEKLCDCCDNPPAPVDCVVGEWGEWSECIDGVQTRTRTVTTPPSNGGAACPPLEETRECSLCQEPGAIGDWVQTTFSECPDLGFNSLITIPSSASWAAGYAVFLSVTDDATGALVVEGSNTSWNFDEEFGIGDIGDEITEGMNLTLTMTMMCDSFSVERKFYITIPDCPPPPQCPLISDLTCEIDVTTS